MIGLAKTTRSEKVHAGGGRPGICLWDMLYVYGGARNVFMGGGGVKKCNTCNSANPLHWLYGSVFRLLISIH